MRQKRATTSVWLYEKACPRCREPLAVSGGVSIE
jgi:hypothetical protein